MLLGCDFSFDKPDLSQLWAAGHRVILVYLSDTSSKGVSAAYAAEALSLGFKILPLYETTAGAALGGYSTGVNHQQTAHKIAARLNIPDEVPVIYALDQDFSTGQLAGPVTEYCKGINSGAREAAVYGGYNQIDYLVDHGAVKSRQNFQTYAWSNGRWLPISVAPIQQYKNGVKVASGTVDLCRVDEDVVSWEENVALTDAEIEKIAKKVWDLDYIPADPTNATNPNWTARNALANTYTQAYKAAQKPVPAVPTAAEVAAAVVAALPPASTGGITPGQVTQAVLDALAKLKLSLAP